MTDHLSEFEIRGAKIGKLREKGINPYPATATPTLSIGEFLARFESLQEQGATETLVGRILLEREHGKLLFFRVLDDADQIQAVVSRNDIGDEQFLFIQEFVDVGDIVELVGTAFVTKKGEQSLLVHSCRILSKALSPLPDKWHGIRDEEMRYRKRYLDLLLSPELKELFHKKSRFWNATRNYLVQNNFMEVETPVLENTTGGADAQPFVTHHNALDMDVYLRISMGELWQKRLMVAGFTKTFEIGRQFRNEGMSPEHLQDYSQMEMYWAYADYEKGMSFVQGLYQTIAQETLGSHAFTTRGFDIDLSGDWPRLDYTQAIQEKLGIHVLDASIEELVQACKNIHGDVETHVNRGRLIDMLWKHCRKSIAGPVFLVNHPVEVSPLAKRRESDPRTVERFQVIIAGSEVGNGYSELNDPIDQRMRFEEQARLRAEGDTEAQMDDAEFVEALEYAMPPTCGFGFSERLFSFMVDKPIKECVLFPLLRPKQRAVDVTTVQHPADEGGSPLNVVDEIEQPGITVEAAYALLYNEMKGEQLLKHSKAAAWQMRAVAQKLNVQHTDAWFIAGLLHDVDYEHCNAETHGHEGAVLLASHNVDARIVSAVEKHNPMNSSSDPETLLEKSLYSMEQLTGLVLAAVAVRPDKNIHNVELKSLKKKFKDKSFAAAIDRTITENVTPWLGISIDEALELTLVAMQEGAQDIGIEVITV